MGRGSNRRSQSADCLRCAAHLRQQLRRHPTQGTRPLHWEHHLVRRFGADWMDTFSTKRLTYVERLQFIVDILLAENFSQNQVDLMFSAKNTKILRGGSHMCPDRSQTSRVFTAKRQKLQSDQVEPPFPPPPIVDQLSFLAATVNTCAAQFFGDNESLINQLNLMQRIGSHEARITDVISAFLGLWQSEALNLRTESDSLFVHIPRALNAAADYLVNKALDLEASEIVLTPVVHQNNLSNLLALRGFSDGGVRHQSMWYSEGSAACGWVVQGGFSMNSESQIQWTTLAYGSIFLVSGITSFEAELAGVEGLTQTLLFLFLVPGRCGDASSWFHNHLLN